jgi:hypothetical protein
MKTAVAVARMEGASMGAAFKMADRVCALMASEDARQQTFGMEFDEFREWLAYRLVDVVEPDGVAPRRVNTAITEQVAKQLLANADPVAMSEFRACRHRGQSIRSALNRALRALSESREHD